jgi:enamine deaminase RidA (YjgF/YER057c/UK114 family)
LQAGQWIENFAGNRNAVKEKFMEINTRRSFFGKLAALAAVVTGAPKIFAQQAPPATPPAPGAAPGGGQRRGGGGGGFGGGPRNNVHDGVFWFSGTGSNDGYSREDHVTVKDPFEKHVTRTMDALKKTLERAGSNMDSIIHLDVFTCLPLDDSLPMPTGSARFAAHLAQYQALNKIYGTYFSPGKAPSRACMALEWIPGDSLIEIRGNALIVNPPAPPTPPAGE